MLEADFKTRTLQKLKERVPYDLYIYVSNTRSYPDTVILGRNNTWAALEFKKSANAARQPNQGRHIGLLAEMGYASFVYPENSEEILDELERLFCS